MAAVVAEEGLVRAEVEAGRAQIYPPTQFGQGPAPGTPAGAPIRPSNSHLASCRTNHESKCEWQMDAHQPKSSVRSSKLRFLT